jgi:hypothetical protein
MLRETSISPTKIECMSDAIGLDARSAPSSYPTTAYVRETNHAMGGCHNDYVKWEVRNSMSFRNPGFAQDDRHPVVCVTGTYVRTSYRNSSEEFREGVQRGVTRKQLAAGIQAWGGEWASRRVRTTPIGVRQKPRCRDHHRHITAQELSDPPVPIVMEGDPALVEGEIKGWRLSGRFARCDIGYRPILFSRCAEVVLGDRQ